MCDDRPLLEVRAQGKRSSTLILGNGNCFGTAREGQNFLKKSKKVLAGLKNLNIFINVLGGTAARYGIRRDGLQFFYTPNFFCAFSRTGSLGGSHFPEIKKLIHGHCHFPPTGLSVFLLYEQIA